MYSAAQRAAAARYPHDAGLATLLADLRAGSDEFSVIWDTYPVRVAGHRTKSMLHPEVGRLQVSCDVLTVPDDDQQVVFVTADPASRSARALRHLAATLPGEQSPTASPQGTDSLPRSSSDCGRSQVT